MSYQFRNFTPAMSLNVLQQKQFTDGQKSTVESSIKTILIN